MEEEERVASNMSVLIFLLYDLVCEFAVVTASAVQLLLLLALYSLHTAHILRGNVHVVHSMSRENGTRTQEVENH